MPHRGPLLALLARYRPVDAADAARARRLTEFVERNPRCFDRGFTEGHVTGSAWLVDPSGTRVLLTHHRKLGLWLQLCGHADGDADILRVARREAEEESGIGGIAPVSPDIFDIDIHEIPERPNEPAHLHYDVRFAFRADSEKFISSGESHALEWVEISRLDGKTSETSMLRMRDKWKSPGKFSV